MGNAQQGCSCGSTRINIGCSPEIAAHCGTMCSRPNCDDQDWANLLLVNSAKRGEVADTRRALAGGADPNTTAMFAIQMGDIVRRNQQPVKQVTPLMRACSNGFDDVVLCLIDARALPTFQDSRGWTAPMYALAAGEFATAALVAEKVAESEMRQLRVQVQKQRVALLTTCEEDAGQEVAERLRKDLDAPGIWALPPKLGSPGLPLGVPLIKDLEVQVELQQEDDAIIADMTTRETL